jgi:hypothetical protein
MTEVCPPIQFPLDPLSTYRRTMLMPSLTCPSGSSGVWSFPIRVDSKARKRHADAGIGERRDEPTQAIRQKPVVTVEELDQLALGLPDAAVMIRDGTNVYSVSQRANPGIVESHHMIERRVCGCVIDNEAFEIGISLLKRTR